MNGVYEESNIVKQKKKKKNINNKYITDKKQKK
jgi:hypothetical protein